MFDSNGRRRIAAQWHLEIRSHLDGFGRGRKKSRRTNTKRWEWWRKWINIETECVVINEDFCIFFIHSGKFKTISSRTKIQDKIQVGNYRYQILTHAKHKNGQCEHRHKDYRPKSAKFNGITTIDRHFQASLNTFNKTNWMTLFYIFRNRGTFACIFVGEQNTKITGVLLLSRTHANSNRFSVVELKKNKSFLDRKMTRNDLSIYEKKKKR